MLRSILIFLLCLLAPATTYAQGMGNFVIVLSALDWWVVIGALLCGVLLAFVWAFESRATESLAQSELESDQADSIEVPSIAKPQGGRTIFAYAIAGFATGAVLTLAVQIPVAYTYGIVALKLLVSALMLFGVVRLGAVEGLYKYLAGNRPLGTAVALILAIVAVWLFESLFQHSLVASELRSVAALAAMLAVGIVIGGSAFSILGSTWTAPTGVKQCQHLAGIVMVALAIYLAGKIPQFPEMLLWAVYLVILAVYCGATSKIALPAKGQQSLLKGAGIVILIFGVVGLLSAALGYRDFSQPIGKVAAMITSGGVIQTGQNKASQAGPFEYVKNIEEFDQILVAAKQASKPVVIDFYADWCLDCKRMDRTTFKDPVIFASLTEDFDSIKVDVTDPNEAFSRALRKRFKVFGPPAMLFIDRVGNLSSSSPAYGYLDVEELAGLLAQVQ